jgi:Cof subfamily protein (haloacid dehalogenase superfamily)
MKKKLFITDFDRTLLRDDKTIAQKDINILKNLKKKGVVSCVATGRSIYSFRNILKGFKYKLPIDYLIFSTGAGIMDFSKGKILKSFSLKESDVIYIADYFEKCEIDYMVHRPVPETHYFVYRSSGSENQDFKDRINLYKEYSSSLEQLKKLNGFGKSTEVLSVVPCESVYAKSDMIEKIKQDLSQFSVIIATSPLDHRSLWIEVFNKDVSKSKAAAFLTGNIGVDKEDVFSIGNDYNDIDLLKWSGRGFVVENAPEDLKKLFEQVPSNNNCGVSTAVEKCIKT